jgi:undecaprenyl-diphosphatase
MNSIFGYIDTTVNVFMTTHASPVSIFIATWISIIADAKVLLAVTVVLIIYYMFHKKWHDAIILACATGGTAVIVLTLKDYFMRLRPDNALQVIVNDPSFPSGHASMSAAFFVVLIALCTSRIPSRELRIGFVLLSTLMIYLVGMSRLVLNVHWASDVLVGWSIGSVVALVSVWVVRKVLK